MDQRWTSTLVLGLLSAPLPLCDLGKTLGLGSPCLLSRMQLIYATFSLGVWTQEELAQ